MSAPSPLDRNEIPRDWAQKRFGDFASLQRGYDLPAAHRVPGDVPVIGSNGVVGYHNQSMVTGPGVLTGRSGTMGLSHYVDRDFWPLNTALFVTDFHSNFPLFAHYFFSFFDFGQFAAGASVPTLNRNLVHDASIFVPPLIEQQAIAGVLSKIQSAVQVQEKIVAGIRELKAATMAKLFREGLRGERRKQTEIGEIPKSWEVAPLGSVLRAAQYGLSFRGNPSGSIPILRMNCQQDGLVVFRDLQFVDLDERTSRQYLLRRGDILFNRTNSHELVGRTALFNSERDAVFASYLIRLQVDPDLVDSRFLNWYLNLTSTQIALKAFASRGVSQSNISASKLKTLFVPRPDLKEQRQIAEHIGFIENAAGHAERRLSCLRSLFSSTLNLLMTGQVRVPVSKEA